MEKVWHKGPIFKLKQNGISGKLLSTFTDILKHRKKTVLNAQLSSWSGMKLWVPQGSVLSPLLFWCISTILQKASTNARLFENDVSPFSVVHNINLSAINLNGDLTNINARANQRKMTFNPHPNKQLQEVVFCHKIKKTSHPQLNFNSNFVKQMQFQKHLVFYLDGILDFRQQLRNMFKQVNTAISLW